MIYGFAYYFSTKWNHKFKIKERLYIIIYIIQPAYVDLIFSNLICEEIDGRLRLKESPGLECWTSTYASWVLFFCIPTFVVWLLVLPYLFYKHIHEYITSVKDITLKNGLKITGVKRLSHLLKRGTVCDDSGANSEFLFLGYKNRKKCFVWEILNYIGKMMVILINQGINNNELKLHLMLLILILFFIAESVISPYSMRVYNALDYLSKITLIITCYCLVWTTIKDKDTSQIFLFILMIIVHCLFIIFSLILSLRGVLEKRNLWPQFLRY